VLPELNVSANLYYDTDANYHQSELWSLWYVTAFSVTVSSLRGCHARHGYVYCLCVVWSSCCCTVCVGERRGWQVPAVAVRRRRSLAAKYAMHATFVWRAGRFSTETLPSLVRNFKITCRCSAFFSQNSDNKQVARRSWGRPYEMLLCFLSYNIYWTCNLTDRAALLSPIRSV